MTDPHLDLFSVAVLLLAALVGPQLAPALAAYIVILIGALIGVLPALRNRSATSTTLPVSGVGTMLFVVALVAWSMGLTVSASLLIQSQSGVGYQWLLFPVSFTISAIGERWFEFPAIVWRFVKSKALAMLPKGDSQ